MTPAVRVTAPFNEYAVGDVITDPDLVARLPQTDAAFVEVGTVDSGEFSVATAMQSDVLSNIQAH